MAETQTPMRKEKRTMDMHEGCLFMATYTKTEWQTRCVFPCSITDNGDGKVTIVSTEAAFSDWEARHQYSSPCVYWP
jgi:hypothetical protein